MAGLIVLIVLFVLFLLFCFLIWPSNGRRERMLDFANWYIAHRGLHDNKGPAPENSMAAFKLAVEKGYGIEFDVHLTRDEQLVIFHDHTTDRIQGMPGKVEDMSLKELRSRYLFASKEKAPTLWQVLQYVQGRVPLIVELKAERHQDVSKLCEAVAFELDAYEGLTCVESFHPGVVYWFRKNRPQMLRGQLSEHFKEEGPVGIPMSACLFNFLTRPDFIAYNMKFADYFAFRFMRNVCQATCVAWTVHSPAELREAEKNYDVFIFEGFEPGKPERVEMKAQRLKEEAKMGGIVRKHMLVSGDVQGVGFRYRATYIAQGLGVTGWVKNLYDERVEMEVQGTEDQIAEMIRRLGAQRYVEIRDIEEETIPVDPRSYEFKVRY